MGKHALWLVDKMAEKNVQLAIQKSHECMPSEFAEVDEIKKCGIVDAYEVKIINKGEPLTLYFTGGAMEAMADKLECAKLI